MITCTTIILDASGSMSSSREEAVEMFNEQVETAQNEKPNTRFSLVTFSSDVDEPQFWLDDVTQIEGLEHEDYQPGGRTALYDAVGSTIERLNDEAPSEADHLFIIITDGMENNSNEYSGEQVQEMIEEREDKDWTFLYLGGAETLEEAEELQRHAKASMRIKGGQSAGYAKHSMRKASATLASASQTYYGTSSPEERSDLDLGEYFDDGEDENEDEEASDE